ncbi:MAG: hypothetical protein ACFFBD_27920 [Candidatus Hodarchaeota archaeon]
MLDKSDIGLLVITFSTETGPDVFLEDSDLNEVATLFLSVRGFTVVMAGVNYKFHGPGKIRGTLAIPDTEKYGIAFDIILTDKVNRKDDRLKVYSPVLVFLIVSQRLINVVRIHFDEIESWLQKKTLNLQDKSDITSAWFKRLVRDLRAYIQELSESTKLQKPQSSLYDAAILLSLPSLGNQIAQAILRIQRQNSPKGATLKTLSQETGLKEEAIKRELNQLSSKGLIEIHEINREIFFYAPKPE